MRFLRFLTLAAAVALGACGSAPDDAAPQAARDDNITVAGHFGEGGDASEDVSGLACDWQGERADGAMRCLAVEDEGGSAQWAGFDGAVLEARERIGLLDAATPLGAPPEGICDGSDPGSGEFDGEAAAFDDGVFYVTGSHGCSRNSDELRPAGFLVARIAPDEPGLDVHPGTVAIDLSHRLGALLRRSPPLLRYFGASPNRANGLNIEGLAVREGRMVFGLRAPVIDGHAFLFETTAATMFERDIVGTGRAIPVELGPQRGIRDLAFLPDGRLLILSGPAQEQDIPYRLHLYDEGDLSDLTDIAPPGGGKAEAIAIVGVERDRATLLVLFDGARDGAPRRIIVDLP